MNSKNSSNNSLNLTKIEQDPNVNQNFNITILNDTNLTIKDPNDVLNKDPETVYTSQVYEKLKSTPIRNITIEMWPIHKTNNFQMRILKSSIANEVDIDDYFKNKLYEDKIAYFKFEDFDLTIDKENEKVEKVEQFYTILNILLGYQNKLSKHTKHTKITFDFDLSILKDGFMSLMYMLHNGQSDSCVYLPHLCEELALSDSKIGDQGVQ
mmetsp:Transcript_71794/g.155028  ORF Transcript_71794/g.155028 Transcript_71794/m.155028 type:complete len:210 (-) Transcript_71794:756-1385(-)